MPERHKWLISMLIVHSPHPRRNTSTSIRVKQHSSWTPIKGGNKSWMYSNQTFLFHLHCDRLMRTLQFTRNHWYNLKWPKALVFCRCLRTYHQFIISLYCIACRSRSLSLSCTHTNFSIICHSSSLPIPRRLQTGGRASVIQSCGYSHSFPGVSRAAIHCYFFSCERTHIYEIVRWQLL